MSVLALRHFRWTILKQRNLFSRGYATKDGHFNPFEKRKIFSDSDSEDRKIANRICFTVLGNGSLGEPLCLAIFTDFKTYLFNCGEGVQRLCNEHDIKLLNAKHVFVTYKSWKNMAGIPDVYLTHKSFGVRRMTLHGPPGIGQLKSIILAGQDGITLRTKLFTDPYFDDTLHIDCIPVYGNRDLPPLAHAQRFTKRMQEELAVAYLCKIFEKRGEFMPGKCVEYGVPIGPCLLQLKNGGDITLPSGKKVLSSDVHKETLPGMTFLVVECPEEHFLDNFVREEKFQLEEEISAVFHFSPQPIVRLPKYQQWIGKFPQNTQHYILNGHRASPSGRAIYETQHVLHLLHPRIFQLLHEEKQVNSHSDATSGSVIYPPTMLQLHVRPTKHSSRSNVVQLDPESCVEAAKSVPGFVDELEHLKSLFEKCDVGKAGGDYPEVLFLGTCSSTSTGYRNVSAILINTSATSSVLLDCGEGTFNQMVRYFGPNRINATLRNLTCIFVSHFHVDHYMGLFQLLKSRREAFRGMEFCFRPLLLILPPTVGNILKRFDGIFENFSSDCRIISCRDLIDSKNGPLVMQEFAQNIQVCTVPVKHCYESYGVVLDAPQWKIVYSGDTAPCQKLIDAGKDCTLLIHEASIEDDFANEASLKLHSTPSQVMDVSERMNAKYTLMTHFSRRYLAVPVFEPSKERPIGCAFDFMKVRLCDLPLVPHFLPVVQRAFQEMLETHSERTSTHVKHENVILKSLTSV